jgi:carboxymethylenebutenolidase
METASRMICAAALTVVFVHTGLLGAQSIFEQALEASERHQEWVQIEYNGRTVDAFLVYPETGEKAHSVVVIHENRGLNVWVRTVADRLAEAGYVAIAPDLLSGMGPEGGRTSGFENADAAREAIYRLDPQQITNDLAAVAEFVRSLPAADSTVSVAGFCWGGAQSFRFATNFTDLEAAYVFYGRPPESLEELGRITAPVYGFYGGADARVNQTIAPTSGLMLDLGKTYEPVVYEGAGHGFMRRGVSEDPSLPDAAAADAAWGRWLQLLSRARADD